VTNTGRALLLSKVTEKEWLATVRGWAKLAGWRTYHTLRSFGSAGGFPDLVLVRAATGEILWVELKTEKGKVRPDQQAWIDDLTACGQRAFVWRPSQEALVKSVLGVTA
jgi:hypothetical protein